MPNEFRSTPEWLIRIVCNHHHHHNHHTRKSLTHITTTRKDNLVSFIFETKKKKILQLFFYLHKSLNSFLTLLWLKKCSCRLMTTTRNSYGQKKNTIICLVKSIHLKLFFFNKLQLYRKWEFFSRFPRYSLEIWTKINIKTKKNQCLDIVHPYKTLSFVVLFVCLYSLCF